MPISPMDEFLAHQTSETFDHVHTSDRNFYDRFYFNCHPSSDELFLITGLGQYPNLGVTDAFVSISHGDQHTVVRASRELGSDRFDTSVGPLRVEVLEGLMKLRVVCEPNEWGVAFDMTFTGTVPAQEEPKTFQRQHGRVTSDVSRFAQVGTWQGTLEVAGRTYEVTPDRWKGARDRSWGVRGVGEAEPPGIRIKNVMEGTAGFFHQWMPMQFDDFLIKVQFDELFDGTRIQEEAVKIYNLGVDKPEEPLGRPDADITYIPGTREIERAVIKLAPPGGGERRITSTPLRTVYLKAGTGYMPHEGWGHGYYQGPLKVEGLHFDMSTQAKRSEWAALNETLARFELDTGEVAYGLHENLVIGTYHPHGFDAPDRMAP
ncbi:MAG: hypothetical protein CL910_20475 [Deltaproteobacteria bacterium]|nr:hypothetical protein [Deltaproteobacteria bacterium]